MLLLLEKHHVSMCEWREGNWAKKTEMTLLLQNKWDSLKH